MTFFARLPCALAPTTSWCTSVRAVTPPERTVARTR